MTLDRSQIERIKANVQKSLPDDRSYSSGWWPLTDEIHPPVNLEVLFFRKEWVTDKDQTGVKVGILTEDGDIWYAEIDVENYPNGGIYGTSYKAMPTHWQYKPSKPFE